MNIAELIVLTIAITQFIKTQFPQLKIQGPLAVLLSAVASAGAVFYSYMKGGILIDWNIIAVIVEVFVGANFGKKMWGALKR